MYLKLGLFTFFLIVVSFVLGQPVSLVRQTQPLARPKLVVGIVVDQMRWDFLYRYYNRYGTGGFKRLLNEGFSCENATINYLPSFTAVGHASIFTGSVPALDGITGNDWTDQLTGKQIYCTEDSSAKTLGSNSQEGAMSPRNLLASTITDELRIATNFESRVVGISLKDRAAILPAGHTATAAFWLDDTNGHFISSSYYMEQLPEWLNQFNNSNRIVELIANDWNTLYPLDKYDQSDSLNQSYEGRFKDEKDAIFPHLIRKAYEMNKGSFRSTPFGNTLTLELAKAAINGYQLGAGHSTDFLTINCASTDYVGHMFGPNSVEVEDTYLRLDKELAHFFEFLDAKIGKGTYTVFLTADHGAAHAIGYMKKHNLPADFWHAQPLLDSLNYTLASIFGVKHLIRSGMNYQVNFNMNAIISEHLNFDSIKKITVEYLERQPGIAYAVDMARIGETSVPEPLKTMIINGYNFKRSGAVQVVLQPGWFEGYSKTGTTHGTWNPYDTHIPLVFMGWGISHGASTAIVHMTDIAPTLAVLLHVQVPNASIGTPIREVLK
jgi:predicted AlkP superfamily pyrophosphatase or phosphodiesterase